MFKLILLSLCPLSLCISASSCKSYRGDNTWPSTCSWQALNETVSGRLTAPTGLGEVCHPDSSFFNNATCGILQQQWSNTSWVASNPWLADYNDESCPPSAVLPCTSSGYPAFVIEAINAADIQAGINFARDNNVRLIIKGTGHDYPGRSDGAGSLSLWTHKIKGISVTMNDTTAAQYGGIGSVKIAAGHRWGEVYAEVSKHNITVVGGADPNVGVGGWILNGGHSPISSLYGLGADQVLAFEVITPDGKYLNVNETSHPDLFWALRGGGGSTYAAMLSVTVKAYPQLSGGINLYSLATKAGSDTFWSLVAYFHSQIPAISEAGGMGYHYVVRGASLGSPDSDLISGAWFFPQKTVGQMDAVLNPLIAAINSSSWVKDPVYLVQSKDTFFDSAMSYLSMSTGEAGGSTGRLGSWLLDGPALTSNFTLLREQLKASDPSPWLMISHVVAGPGVRKAANNLPGGSNAVLPAWRKAYTHIVLPRSWLAGNTTLKNAVTSALRDHDFPALKALAPNSGGYVNENDPSNPNWKEDYYGENYARLLEIKHKYDPQGVFWCKPCVGWDEWEIKDGPVDENVLEWGIGQGSGRLCKKE